MPDSEEWSAVPTDFFGKQHFEVVKSIAQGALSGTGAGWFMTLSECFSRFDIEKQIQLTSLVGTIHMSVSDAGLISKNFAASFSNETSHLTLDPRIANLQYVQVATDFVEYVKAKNITRLLAKNAVYPNFQAIPNASTLKDPWEVHVAPAIPSYVANNGPHCYGRC